MRLGTLHFAAFPIVWNGICMDASTHIEFIDQWWLFSHGWMCGWWRGWARRVFTIPSIHVQYTLFFQHLHMSTISSHKAFKRFYVHNFVHVHKVSLRRVQHVFSNLDKGYFWRQGINTPTDEKEPRKSQQEMNLIINAEQFLLTMQKKKKATPKQVDA